MGEYQLTDSGLHRVPGRLARGQVQIRRQVGPVEKGRLAQEDVAAVGEPRMATPQQMQKLEDSPAYFRSRRKNKVLKPLTPLKLQKYVIDYGVIDPQLRALAAKTEKPSVLEFAAAAYDTDGRLMNSMLNEGALSGERRAETKSHNIFHATQALEVPADAEFIRLAVRNTINNRTGTIEVTLPLKGEVAAKSSLSGSPVH